MINKNHFLLLLLAAVFTSLGFVGGKMLADISPEVISQAEVLVGLEFTPVERDSMHQNLRNHRASFETM